MEPTLSGRHFNMDKGSHVAAEVSEQPDCEDSELAPCDHRGRETPLGKEDQGRDPSI